MKNAILYFIISPFLGFIQALRNYRQSWAKPTLIAFIAFFGFTMVKNDTVDSSRYIHKLEEMYASNKNFDDIKASLYSDEGGGQTDVYVTIVTYFVSWFTNSGNFLFLIYALIFGYFYVNNAWMVLDQSKGKLRWEQILLLISFSSIVAFWDVNAVRMWTAAQVFFYGGFLYLYQEKKKGLIIATSSLLIHFSFILPVALLLAYSLVRLNFRFLYFFYIASFFIAELNIGFIHSALEANMPGFLQPKIKTYFNDEYLEGYEEVVATVNWYVLYYKKLITYFNVVFISILFFKADLSKPARRLLGFSLLFLGVANIISLLPSGGRFLNVAFLFSLAFSFIVVSNNKVSIIAKSVKWLSPILILFIVISIRMSFDYISIITLTNPIVALFTDINTSLIELIK
ncbi:MAG TPA: hypothetical protein PKN96_07555 [Flavobacterium sp.]|uniref:hypothetical protein n=1 Tax=Flavobacterium sp. TaxID=239 RepID=UPI002CB0C50A|nr:hypothetical protein [Flavobacterium sp.]HNP33133.1 hypothetical protein [Flavobacterium sp.]